MTKLWQSFITEMTQNLFNLLQREKDGFFPKNLQS